MAFADLPRNRNGSTQRTLGPHVSDRACNAHSIEHKRTLPDHLW